MKLSLNWIKDYVQIPDDMDLKKLAYDLTMETVEVEDCINLAAQFDKMLVGQIVSIEQHPNADKLKVCKTDIGNGEIKDIVCGGTNLSEGMKVAVSAPGAMVRWHGEGDLVEIKKSKLRGVESYGMICASIEIGLADLFPASCETEILDLSFVDAPAGTSLADALSLNDTILEIDNKSMTNRPDLWGHYGIAREISTIYDLPLKKFEPFTCDVPELPVEVLDTERCPRYTAMKISGLSVKPAPYEMQSRIWRVGMRPINALVDITNYVMLATGQPTHAFDSDNISGHIVVRRANKDESLLLLNQKELKLTEDDLVITDSEGAVGLAGVMGGAKDSVLETTNKVILEIANFDAAGIRRTALRYDSRTEAASRYEKAIDPERCDLCLSLSMQLFKEQYPEMVIESRNDIYPNKLKCTEIDVSLNWLERRLGQRIPNEFIINKLEHMGFELTFNGDIMHVKSPSWRSTGDISIKEDILEEIARMYGYDNIVASSFSTSFSSAIRQLDKDLQRNINEYLAFRCDMHEIYTYPWMNDEFVNAILQDTNGILTLSTPPSPSEKYVRSSLIPNICKAVVVNQRYYNEFRIYEMAQIFKDCDYTTPYSPIEKLPYQRKHLAGAFVGDASNVTDLYRTCKGVIENMPLFTHMEAFTFKQIQKPVWADDVVWVNICLGNECIGNMALLNKKAAIECGIKNVAVMLFEIDVDSLKPLASRTNHFDHLPEFPMNDYDFSMLFDAYTSWADIYDVIISKKGNDELLRGASFVDEYTGKQIPAGKKSITVRLKIGSLTKTLTSSEIEKCANTVIKRLSKLLNAEARGK